VPQDGIYELLGSSYDNTGALGANTWRHVEFIEQRKPMAGLDTGITIGVPETAVGPTSWCRRTSSADGALGAREAAHRPRHAGLRPAQRLTRRRRAD
jgi:hypothetical protein